MKRWMLVFTACGMLGPAYSAEPGLLTFKEAPFDFVPMPLAKSTIAELMRFQEMRMAEKKTTPLIPPALPRRLLDSRPGEPHMMIIEPNSDIQYAMPIVTPNPDVDYKLHVIQPGTAAEDGK